MNNFYEIFQKYEKFYEKYIVITNFLLIIIILKGKITIIIDVP